MNLRLLHAALPVAILEETQHRVERTRGIVQQVGKGPPLAVLQELLAQLAVVLWLLEHVAPRAARAAIGRPRATGRPRTPGPGAGPGLTRSAISAA
mgnify:CR=1 FL=1